MNVSQRKLGALLSYAVLGLNNLVGLLYTPFLLRMLGQSEYGMYSVVASVVAYLTVLDLGFGNAIVRYTAKFRAEGKVEEQYRMFGMFFLLYCAIGLLALGAGCVFLGNAERIFGAAMTPGEMSRLKIMLVLMVANLAFTFPMSLFSSVITAYEQFVFSKVVILLRVLLNTATMLVLLNFGYKAIALVVVATVYNVLTLGSHLWFCVWRLKVKLRFGKIDWSFLKEVAVYSFWIFLNAIMDRIYWSTGQFVLGAVSGAAAVAVYAVAVKLLLMYQSFSTAISGVLLPKVTSMAVGETDGKEISDLFIRTGRLQFAVLAVILSGFFLFGRQFVDIWAGKDYSDAYLLSLIFFVPITVALVQNVGITILQARNRMKSRSIILVCVAIFSLALQIPLAKFYGGFGAAIAVAVALVLGQGVAMNVYYARKERIDIVSFWKEILKMSAVPLPLSAAAFLLLREVSLDTFPKLAAGICAYLAVYLPLFYKFSMNDYERRLVSGPVAKILLSLLRK